MDESPAPVKNSSPQLFGDIDRFQIGRAECRHKKNELQVRHPGILDIE